MKNKLAGLDPAALIASEVAYIGSFVRGPKLIREKDFYANRSMIINPADMHDDFSSAVLEGVVRLYHQNEVPSIENLAHIMLNEGLIAPDSPAITDQAKAWSQVSDLLNYYAERGAKELRSFRKREHTVRENWRTERLSPKHITKILETVDKNGGSSLDAATAIRQYMDSLIGDTEMDAVVAKWDKQKEFLEQFPEQQRSLIGQARFTFPSMWGAKLSKLIPVIRPGEMIVLAGGTGDGKSAMAMQFAEWSAISGKNVLVIHMEDYVDIILMRQTCRWLGATMEELEKGDPKGKMQDMIELREAWMERGGSLIYKYLAGHTIQLLVEQIKETAQELERQGKHLDLVVMDYFQKADFDSGVTQGQNYVNIANQGAELLKIVAQKLALTMCVISQETSDGNGGKHTEWTKALEKKPQVYVSLTRQEIKKPDEEEFVTVSDGGRSKTVALGEVGDRSCWIQFKIKKANQSKQGEIWLYFEGPRFRAFDPEFMKKVEAGEATEFDVSILTAPDDAFWRKQDETRVKYTAGWHQLKSPDQKRREKAEAAAKRREQQDEE